MIGSRNALAALDQGPNLATAIFDRPQSFECHEISNSYQLLGAGPFGLGGLLRRGGRRQQQGYEVESLDISAWHFEGSALWDSSNGWLELTPAAENQVGTAFSTAMEVDGAPDHLDMDGSLAEETSAMFGPAGRAVLARLRRAYPDATKPQEYA